MKSSRADRLSHLTVSEQLQQSIEATTQLLEQENRESTFLSEQIKLYEEELSNLTKHQSMHISAIRSLEVAVSKEKKLLNEEKETNQGLRESINKQRLELIHIRKSCENSEHSISSCHKEAKKNYRLISRSSRFSESQRKQLFKLTNRRTIDTDIYKRRISELKKKILPTQEDVKPVKVNFEPVAIMNLLSTVIKIWVNKVRKKKNALEDYNKYIEHIKLGFTEIESAMGLSDYNEIVDALLKSENRNQEVTRYLNYLTEELELVEESTSYINKQIIECKDNNEISGKAYSERVGKLVLNLSSCFEETEEFAKKDQLIWNILRSLGSDLKNIRDLLKQTHIQNIRSAHVHFDDVHSDNIAVILDEIEELVSIFKICFLPNLYPKTRNERKESINEIESFCIDSDIAERTDIVTHAEFKIRAKHLLNNRKVHLRSLTPMI